MKTKKVWFHFNEIRIERLEIQGKPYVRVFDGEGDVVFDLPGRFDDVEVKAIADVINQGFNLGYELGQSNRSREFRELLEINRG